MSTSLSTNLIKSKFGLPNIFTMMEAFGRFSSIIFQGGKYKKLTRADGKVIVITGANTGIGKETVKDLAKRGAHIYMACRDIKKCEEAKREIILETKNHNIFCRECDLASFESIREFVRNFKREQSKIDVLINNAGVMRCPKALTKDGIELQLGVNHMGHFLLTNLLLDCLKNAAPSRIVVVSSLGHVLGQINKNDLNSENKYIRGDAYNQSKLANILFTRELSKKLIGTGITVNALHPGVVHTELGRHMDHEFSIMGNLFRIMLRPFFKNSFEGAQTSLYLSLDPDLEQITGKYFSDCTIKEVASVAKDDKMAEWLWNTSEKWTGIKFNFKKL